MPHSRSVHANGTAPDSTASPNHAKVVVTDHGGRSLMGTKMMLVNLGAATLEISFNGGESYFTIPVSNEVHTFDVRFKEFHIRGTSATVDWSALIAAG